VPLVAGVGHRARRGPRRPPRRSRSPRPARSPQRPDHLPDPSLVTPPSSSTSTALPLAQSPVFAGRGDAHPDDVVGQLRPGPGAAGGRADLSGDLAQLGARVRKLSRSARYVATRRGDSACGRTVVWMLR
jgi:hypothetical protein